MTLNFKISDWYNNHQAPCVLMIDDLSDSYINKYKETFLNDWGYLGDSDGSSFESFNNSVLVRFPQVKITFFVPYGSHNVIKDNSEFSVKKFSLGERHEYLSFLNSLILKGHEIAHHGSNHGEYDSEKSDIWHQEWVLYSSVEQGVETTLLGKKLFKKMLNIEIHGGKYCGYLKNEFSNKIITNCKFLYWCSEAKFFDIDRGDGGGSKYINFPTTVPGNVFVKYIYITENKAKDRIKKTLKYIQPIINVLNRQKIKKLVGSGSIISIQEHYSPSTTRGIVQSANIHSDNKSLIKIFKLLSNFDIWYANCSDISKYIYARKMSNVSFHNNVLSINFDDNYGINNTTLSILLDIQADFLDLDSKVTYKTIKRCNHFVLNLPIKSGSNNFKIINSFN